MLKRLNTGMVVLVLSVEVAPTMAATTVVDAYLDDAGGVASAQAGQQFWNATGLKDRACSSCHGQDPRGQGRHKRTGKPIAPMARSANPKRYTDARKVAKWFKRNCKWTLGRECSAQEKADVLAWLKTQ